MVHFPALSDIIRSLRDVSGSKALNNPSPPVRVPLPLMWGADSSEDFRKESCCCPGQVDTSLRVRACECVYTYMHTHAHVHTLWGNAAVTVGTWHRHPPGHGVDLPTGRNH